MDGRRFDAVARAVATVQSRLDFLGGAVAAGPALGLTGAAPPAGPRATVPERKSAAIGTRRERRRLRRRAEVSAEWPGVGACAADCLTFGDCPCGACATTTEGKRCIVGAHSGCSGTCTSSADCTDPAYPTCLVEIFGDPFCSGRGNVCARIESSFDACAF